MLSITRTGVIAIIISAMSLIITSSITITITTTIILTITKITKITIIVIIIIFIFNNVTSIIIVVINNSIIIAISIIPMPLHFKDLGCPGHLFRLPPAKDADATFEEDRESSTCYTSAGSDDRPVLWEN
ncbi:hypothetical protein AK812_SmicGene27835 [Symbiodinium microadriaticum]|uniref:Uncharacterized protein n=1 Tax=Symbiodinium microadriaticum TaxID=2951 RepID=A0A1Q9D614_SYMMI|nr:hypothetical protein AK812_SmicGene27835 [Symbiodinium microadriaticum]